MDCIAIARAENQDLREVVELFDLYRQFYGQASDLSGAEKFMSARFVAKDSVVLLARADTRAVGFAQLYPSFSSVSMQPILILNDLFVSSDERGHGIGAALLEAARQFAQDSGAKGLKLSTQKQNFVAQRLYERCGYVRDDAFFHYMLNTLRPS